MDIWVVSGFWFGDIVNKATMKFLYQSFCDVFFFF